MPAQQITIIAPARRASRSLEPAHNGRSTIHMAAPVTEVTVASMLEQLAQTLTSLADAVGQVLAGTATNDTVQELQRSLLPTARRAEAAIQRLRGLALAKTALVVDLSQALTVLVLAADMLGADRRSAPMNVALYVLLQRNAGRALLSLDSLSSQMVDGAR
jgi:hypothetical protein